ncbi:MAG: flagellar motor switch protein FliM [Armatimonadetes bacterium]|nr:flagellar motor switch protein FliM [Armatimonadota bacterium]MBS1703645.1 flagellar motor switch protein FliM [Armatimonadota bacterium]MBS1728345.1 flagellar motor switch protein FliM [Armatimonadota bacterium]
MSDILSQNEIEQLLSTLSSEVGSNPIPGANPPPGMPAKKSSDNHGSHRVMRSSSVAYELYDFRRPDKLSKDQLRTLGMLHDTFARAAGSSISAQTRSSINVEMISMEQIPYDEYLRSISSSVFGIVSLPPLSGQIVVEMETTLIFALVDKMLGGPGRPIERNMLTEIEKPLVKSIMERMLGALKQAWEAVVVVAPCVDGLETSSQFVSVAPPNDIVLVILFEVKIGEVRTAMSLCIPYLVLKPITIKLSAQKWFASSSRRQSPQTRRLMSSQVASSQVDLSVLLGKSKMAFEDFYQIKVGDVIKLDQDTQKDLTLLIGNVAKYKGRPMMNGRKYVFSITEPIQQ